MLNSEVEINSGKGVASCTSNYVICSSSECKVFRREEKGGL